MNCATFRADTKLQPVQDPMVLEAPVSHITLTSNGPRFRVGTTALKTFIIWRLTVLERLFRLVRRRLVPSIQASLNNLKN